MYANAGPFREGALLFKSRTELEQVALLYQRYERFDESANAAGLWLGLRKDVEADAVMRFETLRPAQEKREQKVASIKAKAELFMSE
jgi:hypothetical protein